MPDQIAWELSLSEFLNSSFSYEFLIHRPHEGGTALIGLIALPFKFISAEHSLLITGILFETLSRFIQIKVAEKLFGFKTALLFAILTVFSLPVLLPWGTVNAGLHAISAAFPFAFLYFLSRAESNKRAIYSGLLCGFAIGFCYDNIVLPALGLLFFVHLDIRQKTGRNSLSFILFAFLMLLPHILLRTFADNAFELSGNTNYLQIRGLDKNEFLPPEHLDRIRQGITETLPDSFFLSTPNHRLDPLALRYFVLASVLVALATGFFKRDVRKLILFSWLLVLFYLILYSLSSYLEVKLRSNYVYYRHLAYILPLILLLIFAGLAESRSRRSIAACWLLLCLYLGIEHSRAISPNKNYAYRSAGWIIAEKFGHEPETMISIHKNAADEFKDELLIGYGWGLSVHILGANQSTQRIEQLKKISMQFPAEHKALLEQGIRYSFQPELTPRLDSALQRKYFGN